ncbi:MAG: GAF domain-containing protein [Desulfuromonadaceae bacterium]|nr:GAF domain-containing protein [Desulfuromonadaceae bacterium]MDD5106206.1 GAF domain-containing protein [Desulfuromonadaceae bacterium]
MKIKTKLIANVVFTAAIIGAISLTSFVSMNFLQKKLVYLTEKSTPFQIWSVELQRELLSSIANLVKVNVASTLMELERSKAEANISLEIVADTEISLNRLIGNLPVAVSSDLNTLSQELFAASEERIRSSNAAIAASEKIVQRLKESTARLNDLDNSIRNLQSSYYNSFTAALENTAVFSKKLRSIEELRNLVRELQLIAVVVQNSQSSSALLIAKGKLKAMVDRITHNDYFRSNTSIAAHTMGFADKLAECIGIQANALKSKNNTSNVNATEIGKDLAYKLNDLFQSMDQESMLAHDEVISATSKQRTIFSHTNSANSILVENSQLVTLGLMVSDKTNRLFTLDSIAQLDACDTEIRELFLKIGRQERILEHTLTILNDKKELQLLKAATTSLAAINHEIYSASGIIATLKKKVNAIEQANMSSEKLRTIVATQTVKAKENVSDAQTEQYQSIEDVNTMIRHSMSQIGAVGGAAIVIGIFFGFWIFRSIMRPMRIVQSAVHSQQMQVTEKAALAEAVAGGDLSWDVTVGTALQPDQDLFRNDEMGMVLDSVVQMSEAQVSLDRAFAGMTTSLRQSRREEARRDHLKSGLFELNEILRGEFEITTISDKSLTYMARFLRAGVGIMYLYYENEYVLRPCSTYACPDEARRNTCFQRGEGLPGQVAVERKSVRLDYVPAGYLPVSSALGAADPRSIVIMPIMHGDFFAGVLELGSFEPFSADDVEFLEKSLEGVAIAINVNRSRQLATVMKTEAA